MFLPMAFCSFSTSSKPFITVMGLLHRRCRYKLSEVHICFFSFSFDCCVVALMKKHGNHFCFVVGFSFVLSFCKMFDILLVLILFLFSVPFLFVKKRYGVRGSPRQTVCRTAAVAASIQTLCLPIP